MRIQSLFALLGLVYSLQGHPTPVDDPCAGTNALLNLIDRPTASDSGCVVPFKHILLEMGLQTQHLTHWAGQAQNGPEAELRLGLPFNNEFVLLLPNYNHQSLKVHSGLGAATIGLKHELGFTQHWLWTVEGLVTLQSGSDAFGSTGTGGAFNGIITYTFNQQLNVTFMGGFTSETQSSKEGGRRVSSFNPDVVITYSPTKKISAYVEFYGQSHTGSGEGIGYNFNGGVIYLLTPKFSVDLELGQRLLGDLGGFSHYFGAGITLLI